MSIYFSVLSRTIAYDPSTQSTRGGPSPVDVDIKASPVVVPSSKSQSSFGQFGSKRASVPLFPFPSLPLAYDDDPTPSPPSSRSSTLLPSAYARAAYELR